MSKVMAAHQPNYLPYPGFFGKMRDISERGNSQGVFVIRDDVQYVPDDYHKRNRIRISRSKPADPGFKWLNIPVKKTWTGEDYPMIYEIEIENTPQKNQMHWVKAHLMDIKANYKKTPYFDEFYPGLEDIYLRGGTFEDFKASSYRGYTRLADFNVEIIKYLAKCFGTETEIISSQKDVPKEVNGETATKTLANLARHFDADIYLSGAGGLGYMDIWCNAHREGCMDKACKEPHHYIDCSDCSPVEIVFQKWDSPVYRQRYDGFVPHMAAIDILFNVGYLPYSGENL